jgi:hypothetical protein
MSLFTTKSQRHRGTEKAKQQFKKRERIILVESIGADGFNAIFPFDLGFLCVSVTLW